MQWLNHSIVEGAGVIVSVFLIIFLIRLGWKMYWVLLLATVVLAATGGGSAVQNFSLLVDSLTGPTAFFLVSMILAITVLGYLHQQIGAMDELVEQLRFLIRDPRVLLMVFPAAISLLSPVPGAAVISAPMVEKTGRDLNMSSVDLAMSNIIYRHLVVLITPFNASLIFASALTGLSIARFLSFTVPVIVIVFIILLVILLIRFPLDKQPAAGPSEESNGTALARLLTAASPYIVAIFLGLACGVYFPLAMLAGIGGAMLLYLPRTEAGKTLKERLKILPRGVNWSMILAALAIVVFKDFMQETESFQMAVHYLLEQGIPRMVLIIVLPFITGFITGNNVASLGLAIPILFPFLSPDMLSIRYMGLVYLSSYAGYFGSPVHLCTYLTNEYFQTPLYSLIKRINVYGAVMLAVVLVLALFY